MIRLVPIDPPWEESQGFAAALHAVVAERVEADLKRQVVPSAGIFQPEPEEAYHEPLTVEADATGITVEVQPSERQAEADVATKVKQALREATRELPVDKLREAVTKAEPPFASTG